MRVLQALRVSAVSRSDVIANLSICSRSDVIANLCICTCTVENIANVLDSIPAPADLLL